MAGAGWRQFTRETLASDDVQQYLMDQAVMAFSSTSQRTSELTTPQAGMVTYLQDSDTYQGRTPSSGGALTGGVWRGFGRHWGAITGPLPTPVAGDLSTPQPGDTCYSVTLRCNFVVTGITGPAWRQLDVAQVATLAARNTLATDAITAGFPMPVGFLVNVTGKDRLYVVASAGFRLVGGRAGTEVPLTTGTGAPQTGWTGAGYSGVLQHHGNGMATVTFDIVRSGVLITPSSTGKITNSALLQLPSGWEARTGQPIGPGANGNRPAFGYIGSASRIITLTSVGGSADIAVGATISLSGTYALAAPQDLDD